MCSQNTVYRRREKAVTPKALSLLNPFAVSLTLERIRQLTKAVEKGNEHKGRFYVLIELSYNSKTMFQMVVIMLRLMLVAASTHRTVPRV